ncbi:DNA-directed RNA polymerase, 35 kD subunit [Salmon gill poxvirus]|uniref:DNA-directed RNA polymerase 35 kDa subunit n=1 Tax=Salmon gill poxvirus TaxID=1680908 RepID=A0A0H4Y1G3_9POXV|nr:DNA-directed RNA polymerase, 35 kD subunit [Salmon gill poxvirus]AKR04252.1 DNA-directed RNA polymerase, 35 kD subunit [Salmon gill poxvirus]
MNQTFHVKTKITSPYNALFSTFLTNRYRLPRLTKGIIVSNTTNATHEELLGVLQSIPLYRIFLSKFKNLIGTFDQTDQEHNSTDDVAVFCKLSHDATARRVITLQDFTYFYISQGKMTKYVPETDLEETFFHVLDPVTVQKNTKIDLCFFVASNWTELTPTFIGSSYLDLFSDDEKPMASKEYVHVKPFFKNVTCPVLSSWSTGAFPDTHVNVRFDILSGQENEWKKLMKWILEDLYEYVQGRVLEMPTAISDGHVSLIKTPSFSNVILYAILRNQNVSCINNTVNTIPFTKLDTAGFMKNYKKESDKLLKAITVALDNQVKNE